MLTPTIDATSESGGLVFISYRRSDTKAEAEFIHKALGELLGKHRVFIDLDLQAGEDFRRTLYDRLRSCDVVVVVIGPHWDGDDSSGSALRDSNDFVRLEVEMALRNKIAIVPVLVRGATPPSRHKLPKPLRRLEAIQAVELYDADGAVDTLTTAILRALARAAARRRAKRLARIILFWPATVATVVFLVQGKTGVRDFAGLALLFLREPAEFTRTLMSSGRVDAQNLIEAIRTFAVASVCANVSFGLIYDRAPSLVIAQLGVRCVGNTVTASLIAATSATIYSIVGGARYFVPALVVTLFGEASLFIWIVLCFLVSIAFLVLFDFEMAEAILLDNILLRNREPWRAPSHKTHSVMVAISCLVVARGLWCIAVALKELSPG